MDWIRWKVWKVWIVWIVEARFGATLLHFCSLLLSAPALPRGAAAGAASAEFQEARFGATLLHVCSLLLSATPLGLLPVLPVLNSEKPALEQHSFTLAPFCCLRLGLLPVPVPKGAPL